MDQKAVAIGNGMSLLMDELDARLSTRTPFTHVRFGNGELNNMVGKHGSKLQPRSDALRDELIEAFQIVHHNYLIGCTAGFTIFPDLEPSLREIRDQFFCGQAFYLPDALLRLAVRKPERLAESIRENIRPRRVGLIANETIFGSNTVINVFDVNRSIVAPPTDAYACLTEGWMRTVGSLANNVDIILCALGPTANVIAKRLWQDKADVTFLDVGSLLDGIAGTRLRAWTKKFPDMGAKIEELVV